MYQHADSLPKGKEDENFRKKPDIALKLVNQTLERKYHPGIVLIDGDYGNNSTFLQELEKFKLNYVGGLAKNRLAGVINPETGEKQSEKRLDEIIFSLSKEDFKAVTLDEALIRHFILVFTAYTFIVYMISVSVNLVLAFLF
ncbi:MAG: transposase [Cyanobacteria bacterium P01_G01_bin.19]